MSVLPRTRRVIGERGITFTQLVRRPTRSAAPRAPRCSRAATATTTACRATARRGRLRQARQGQHPSRSWLQRARLHHQPHRQVPERLRRDVPADVPPGWTEWYGSVDSVDLPDVGLHAERERHPADLRRAPASRTRRSTRPTCTARRPWTSSAAAPARAGRSSCRSPSWRPHSEARAAARRTGPPCAGPAPPRAASRASRCRARLFNEADVSRQAAPTSATGRPASGPRRIATITAQLPGPPGVAAVGRRGGAGDRRRRCAPPASWTTPT